MSGAEQAPRGVEIVVLTFAPMPDKIFVHIIESPGAKDFLEDRQEGQVLRSMLSLIGASARVYTVVNRRMFQEAVKRIAAFHGGSEGMGFVPMLHISCHGNEQGLGLTDNGGLSWQDLASIIRPLSVAAPGNLMVSMSSCSGYEALAMARTEDQPPYAILVGPSGPVEWSASAVAFCSYYLQLTKWLDDPQPSGGAAEAFKQLLVNMNAAAGLPADTYKVAAANFVRRDWLAELAALVSLIRKGTHDASEQQILDEVAARYQRAYLES
jgi:hypothetical protein